MNDLKCSWCNKPIDDIIVNVALNISCVRKTLEDSEEKIENSKMEFIETLCPDCFEKFSNILREGMEPYRNV